MKRRRYGYVLNLLLALDQFGAALLGWDCDVTISTQIGITKRKYEREGKRWPRRYWLLRFVGWCLDKIDPNHCEEAEE